MIKVDEQQQENGNIVNLSTEKFGNLRIEKENVINFENGMLGWSGLT